MRTISAASEVLADNTHRRWRLCLACIMSSFTSELEQIAVADDRYSSILSAYGMALADIAVDLSEPYVRQFSTSTLSDLEDRFEGLRSRCMDRLLSQGVHEDSVVYDCYLSLQYAGSDTTLMINRPADGDYARAFVEEHKREFAFTLDSPIMVAAVRVRATSKSDSGDLSERSPYVEEMGQLASSTRSIGSAKPFGTNSVYFEELGTFTDVPLYKLHDLIPGMTVAGPAIILDNTQTIVLHPQNTAKILKSHVM